VDGPSGFTQTVDEKSGEKRLSTSDFQKQGSQQKRFCRGFIRKNSLSGADAPVKQKTKQEENRASAFARGKWRRGGVKQPDDQSPLFTSQVCKEESDGTCADAAISRQGQKRKTFSGKRRKSRARPNLRGRGEEPAN